MRLVIEFVVLILAVTLFITVLLVIFGQYSMFDSIGITEVVEDVESAIGKACLRVENDLFYMYVLGPISQIFSRIRADHPYHTYMHRIEEERKIRIEKDKKIQRTTGAFVSSCLSDAPWKRIPVWKQLERVRMIEDCFYRQCSKSLRMTSIVHSDSLHTVCDYWWRHFYYRKVHYSEVLRYRSD